MFLVVIVCIGIVHVFNQGLNLTLLPTGSHSVDATVRKIKFAQERDFTKPRPLHLFANKINSDSVSPVSSQTVSKVSSVKTTSNHPGEEIRHIGFLKVHKAASSTMQNIFFRFGLKRNLTFVFTEHPNYFSRNAKSHIPLVEPRYRKSYDILCNHGTFDYTIYSSLLPNDTVYLAIVRDPVEIFISGVNYYSQKEQLLSYLAKIPGNRLQNLIRYPERFDRGIFSYTKNVMARDFGFLSTSIPEVVNRKLSELDKIFKLVLLVEYFEESLILMKRYLSWKMQDILFISNNVYSKKGWSLSDLTPEDLDKLSLRNSLDFKLYDFFYEKFWRQFRSEPNDIHMEVLNFKEVLKKVSTFCKAAKSEDNAELVVHSTDWNEEFTVSHQDCDYMLEDELEFIKLLRKRQGSELGQKVIRARRMVKRPRRLGLRNV